MRSSSSGATSVMRSELARGAVRLAAGVDNATNDRHYVVHPLPLRTTFVELGWKY